MNSSLNNINSDEQPNPWTEIGDGDLRGLQLSKRPVWIWSLSSERIEWANDAALAFWHQPDISSLRPASEIKSIAVSKRVATLGDRVALGEVIDEDWTLYPINKPVSVRVIISGCRLRNENCLLCEAVEGVTATKEAGAYALRAFAETFHVSPIAEIVCNRDGRIRFLNTAAMNAFGVMAGARLVDIADGSETGVFDPFLEVQLGETYRTDDVRVGEDSDARWWRIIAQAGKDTTTGEDAVYLYLLDVTAEREAASALSAQEKMFAMAFNALPLGFALKDEDARYIFANEFIERQFGLPLEEIKGKRISEVARFDGVDDAVEADLEALRSRRSSRIHEVHPIAGQLRHILRGREVIDGLDGTKWLLSFGLDMTDQVMAQEELQAEKDFVQAVLDTVPILVFTRKGNGEYGFLNRATQAFLEDKPSLVLGLDPLCADGIADRQADDGQSVYGLVEQRRGRVTTETVYRTASGDDRSFSTTSVPLNRSKGEMEALSVSVDITELRRARMSAERANEAKNGFLAAISHEIRTPLNGVLGIARLLEDTRLDRDQAQMVRTVQESGQHLLSLINDILDFSKIEAGAVTLEEESFDLHSSLSYIADILSPRAQQANIDVIFTVDGDVPRGLTGDLGRVRQILVNLIGNSIKFTKHGGVHLAVDVVKRNGELITLRFAVSDTGIGIPEKALPTLFDPFTQVDSSATRRYEGAGLGLAICMRLATLMNGSLDVVSKIGQGSTFTVELPFIVTESAAGNDVNVRNPFDGLRVALVALSPVMAEGFSTQVKGWGGLPSVYATLDDLSKSGDADFIILPEAAGRAGRLPVGSEQSPTLILLDWLESQAKVADPAAETLRRPVAPLKLSGAVKRLLLGNADTGVEEDGQAADAAEALASNTASALQILAARKTKSLRILIAEDNNVNQYVIGQMVRNVGHTADIVGNGLEAVQAASSLPYDVILMDVRMPEMDGIEATSKIRTLPGPASKIPIIAMTGDVLQETVDACYRAGMDGYIAKPFDRDVLMAELSNLVGSGRVVKTQTISPTLPIADEIDEEMVFEMLQVLGSEDYMRLLDQTVTRMKTVIEDLLRAASVRATDELVQKAHAMQSSLGHLGLKHARDVCLFIEQNASKRDMAEITSEINKLGEVVDRGVARIKSEH